MRFILLPMYFVAAWFTYKIGTCLFSRRVCIWAVILAGLYTRYHLISLEFRTDNLWAPLWLLCITVLVTGPLTVRRALVAGLLLGLCFGVSMKSILFLLSIALAALLTLLLVGRRNLALSWTHLVQCLAAFVASTATIPATIMIALPVILYVARRMISATDGAGLAFRRVFILMVCTSYFLAFKTFWPVRSHDD